MAPTFKPQVDGFSARPEIRVFAKNQIGDSSLNDHRLDDVFGQENFTGNVGSLGVQAGIWF